MPPRNELFLTAVLVLIGIAAAIAFIAEKQRGGETAGPAPVPTHTAAPKLPAPSAQAPNIPGEPPLAGPTGIGNAPGSFDYYALVLSWSPTHCACSEGQRDTTQCAPADGRGYGFVLHGLWPQYERGYPEDCPTLKRPYVRQTVIDKMLDVMPGKGLIIHEYKKHGTCSGLSPPAFFEIARRLYDSIRMPAAFLDPGAAQVMSPREVVQAFVSANPGLSPDMVAVGCGGPGSQLREVRVCFSKAGVPRSCGPNEDQLCRGGRIEVPPVRSSRN
jgi:ribonuclease T2